jgi:hypothetical protein
MSCTGWTGRGGGGQGEGQGWAGRVGVGGQRRGRGAGRVEGGGPGWVGSGWPVQRCYAELQIWRSYINTIRALCVRSDGECDLLLQEILI